MPRSCAASRARRPRICRAGPAIAACARGAATSFDTRRTLREAVRNDGDVMRLRRLKRRPRQRRILLLIDVSGSMKERTETHLRIAHALAHAVERIEVFTFGTRLTRVTRAMRLKQREQALAATSAIVSDWDGGTRIGDALRAFLSVPRFAGYSRGAVVLVLSDGLERGDAGRDARRGDAAVAPGLAAELADAARRRSEFQAADRGAEGDPAAGRRSRRRLVGRTRSARTSSVCEGKTRRMTGIVDAHHHIWRQADMPWLSGPIQPRIFGPYEPLQRDYLIESFSRISPAPA